MRTIKYIDVTFSDQTIWRLPASQVAEARADYFATADAARGDGTYAEVYVQELDYTLSDKLELLDYLNNSMDWADFAETAVLVEAPRNLPDYSREFTNAPKELVWNNAD
jgi:hypothetical protein